MMTAWSQGAGGGGGDQARHDVAQEDHGQLPVGCSAVAGGRPCVVSRVAWTVLCLVDKH